jgi:hypothetical protein
MSNRRLSLMYPSKVITLHFEWLVKTTVPDPVVVLPWGFGLFSAALAAVVAGTGGALYPHKRKGHSKGKSSGQECPLHTNKSKGNTNTKGSGRGRPALHWQSEVGASGDAPKLSIRRRRAPSGLIPDTHAVRLFQQQTSYDKRHASHNHRVIEPGIDIAGGRYRPQAD